MLLPLHCPPDSDRAAPILPTDLKPVKPLLQLTQVLLSQVDSDATDTPTASQTPSSSEPDSKQQTKSFTMNPVTSRPADELALLQTLLLVLKLISLVSAVTSVSASTSTAVAALWKILVHTGGTLRDIQGCKAVQKVTVIDAMRAEHPRHSQAWSDTVVALTKLLMTELRQCLAKEGMQDQADICSVTLELLLGLLPMKRSYCCAVAVASAIKDPGRLPFFAPLHFDFTPLEWNCCLLIAVRWAVAALLIVQSLPKVSHVRTLQQWSTFIIAR